MRETKFGKRCLTWVLIMMMTLSLLPVSALAADGEELDEDATLHSAMFTSICARDTNSATEPEWAVSRSKMATELNDKGESRVTLALPSEVEENTIDVVFVVDNAFPEDNQTAADQADALLEQLKEISERGGLQINAGIVVSGGYKPILYPELKEGEEAALEDIKDAYADMKAVIQASETKWKAQEGRKGSNIQAGIELARDMLNAETTASKDNKFLILISDGGAFSWYDKENNITVAKFFQAHEDYSGKDFYHWCNPGDFGARYTETGETTQVNRSFSELMKMNDEEIIDQYSIANPGPDAWSPINKRGNKQYEGRYEADEIQNFLNSHLDDYAQASIVKNLDNNYVTSREAALYHTAKSIETASGEANVIFVSFAYYYRTNDGHENSNLFRYTEEFKDYLEKNEYVKLYRVNGSESKYQYPENYEGVSASADVFNSIQNDLIYLVAAGSTVYDEMGPDFDFGGLDSMELTVGKDTLESMVVDNTAYFGDEETLCDSVYRFKVEYDQTTDSFVWTINEPVTKENPVQLTYTVKLVNRATRSGTYEVPTNGDTYLIPVDSNNNVGAKLRFTSPKVSYTVSRPHHPTTPTKPDNTVEIPDEDALGLNTDDHFAYIIGYPDGTVQPNGQITRAEATTIFFRLLTDESREQFWSTSNVYPDVKAGQWYNNAISTMTKAGIVDGYPDGTFRPDAPITRAEMAKIISLFAKLDKSESRFSDIAGHWAEAYIKLAAGNGWIEGYPDGTFGPQRNITRAETATMINRVLERVPSAESRLLSRDVMQIWPDSNPGDWFYLAMQEATNSHDYERNAKWAASDEQWTALRETRDWKALEQ